MRIGLPFWRGDTRIEEPVEREAMAWGVGCTTFGPVEVLAGGARSSRWGVGCWIRCGVGCWTRGGGGEAAASEAARAARKSASEPNSSSSSMSS